MHKPNKNYFKHWVLLYFIIRSSDYNNVVHRPRSVNISHFKFFSSPPVRLTWNVTRMGTVDVSDQFDLRLRPLLLPSEIQLWNIFTSNATMTLQNARDVNKESDGLNGHLTTSTCNVLVPKITFINERHSGS